MDIRDIVSAEFETIDADTRVSTLEGIVRETGVKAVVVIENRGYQGLVTERQLNASHRHPKAKVRGLVWHVGKVDPDEDVRTVARLMVGSSAMVLPVFQGDALSGVVTAESLLAKVQPFLRVLTVQDIYSPDLVTAE